MRVVVARCAVQYEGRLAASLAPAVRLIMVKADGCVAVHADGGAYKPLNWMNAPNRLLEEEDRWVVSNVKGERLTIELEEVLFDASFELGVDPGLEKDGVEAELQRLLAERSAVFGEGWTLVRREYPTPVGPVDLLFRDADGRPVAVEVKRRGEIAGVEQLTRYLGFLARDPRVGPDVRGVLAARSVAPQARIVAGEAGVEVLIVDYDELRGIESDVLRLF